LSHGRRNTLILRVRPSLRTGVTTAIRTKTVILAATIALTDDLTADYKHGATCARKKIAVHGSTQTKSAKRQKTATRTDSMSALRDDLATASKNDSSSISSIARERWKT